MNRLTLAVFLVLLLAVGAFAQTDKTVAGIDRRYADIAEKARLCETDDDQAEIGELVMNTLDINARGHQWRAVGIYRPVYKFFYKQVENDEKRLYPDQLVFIKAERRVSNRTYHEEYLFSDAGVLMLFTYKAEDDEDPPNEVRIYYSAGKAIRTVDGRKVADKFSTLDLKYTNERAAGAHRLKELFARSISL